MQLHDCRGQPARRGVALHHHRRDGGFRDSADACAYDQGSIRTLIILFLGPLGQQNAPVISALRPYSTQYFWVFVDQPDYDQLVFTYTALSSPIQSAIYLSNSDWNPRCAADFRSPMFSFEAAAFSWPLKRCTDLALCWKHA